MIAPPEFTPFTLTTRSWTLSARNGKKWVYLKMVMIAETEINSDNRMMGLDTGESRRMFVDATK